MKRCGLSVVGMLMMCSMAWAAETGTVSIDAKKELAGIELGQNSALLDKASIFQESAYLNAFDVKDISARENNYRTLFLKPKPGAAYGSLPIRQIIVAAMYDRVVSIEVNLEPKSAPSSLSKPEEDATFYEKMMVIVEALTMKYGPSKQEVGRVREDVTFVWKGSDITMTCSPFNRNIRLSSQKLLDEAEKIFLQRNEESLRRRRQEAEKLLKNL